MTVPQQVETVITASKVVAVMDHLRNNRVEYLILLALGHLMGATAFVADKAAGVCA